MILNIITGNHFSQKKLFYETNKFFGNPKFSNLISTKNSNYLVKINKKSIKIITSEQCEEKDFEKIKLYIKTLFNKRSILITSSENTYWLNDIKDVTIHSLEKIN